YASHGCYQFDTDLLCFELLTSNDLHVRYVVGRTSSIGPSLHPCDFERDALVFSDGSSKGCSSLSILNRFIYTTLSSAGGKSRDCHASLTKDAHEIGEAAPTFAQ